QTELAGIFQIVTAQVLDALVAYLVEVHGRAECEPRQDRHLGGGVAARDVVAGIRLGEAPALGVRQRLGVARTARHLRENEVGRPVDDSTDALDRSGRQ